MSEGAKPKRAVITARPDEGVIINEPSMIRVRRGKKNKGFRLILEIVTAGGRVKAVKRDLDGGQSIAQDGAN